MRGFAGGEQLLVGAGEASHDDHHDDDGHNREDDNGQGGNRAQFGAHGGDHAALHAVIVLETSARNDKGNRYHCLDRIIRADHRAFGNTILLGNDLFHLPGR